MVSLLCVEQELDQFLSIPELFIINSHFLFATAQATVVLLIFLGVFIN